MRDLATIIYQNAEAVRKWKEEQEAKKKEQEKVEKKA